MRADRLRFLIVEDEVLIALDLEDIFVSRGAVVTLAHSLAEGMLKADAAFDVALLDVRLRDEEVFPIAAKLQSKRVPIVFHSAHITKADVEDRFKEAQVISKPAREDELVEIVLHAAKQSQDLAPLQQQIEPRAAQ